MNFENEYRKEMDNIGYHKEIDFEQLDMRNERQTAVYRKWRAAAAVCAIVIVAFVAINMDKITVYARSLYGSFLFAIGGEEMLLDDLVPLDFDYEVFPEQTKKEEYMVGDVHVTDHSKYGHVYENEDVAFENTGIWLPGAEKLDYRRVGISLSDDRSIGHISTNIIYKGEESGINGIFLTELYKEGKVGFGERSGLCTAYEYAEGKWAYFIRGGEYELGTVQRVYFALDGFVFQLFVKDSEEGTNDAKEILKIMAE